MTLLRFHLLVVGFWLGLIAAEVVLERCAKGPQGRRTVAVAHHWIDIFCEIPILLAIVVSGGLLLARVWPGTPLLWVKVGVALIAIAANVVCVPLVHARWKTNNDEHARVLTNRIGITGFAIPFALVALVIGIGLTS